MTYPASAGSGLEMDELPADPERGAGIDDMHPLDPALYRRSRDALIKARQRHREIIRTALFPESEGARLATAYLGGIGPDDPPHLAPPEALAAKDTALSVSLTKYTC
jgi:hypothetical protein